MARKATANALQPVSNVDRLKKKIAYGVNTTPQCLYT